MNSIRFWGAEAATLEGGALLSGHAACVAQWKFVRVRLAVKRTQPLRSK